MSCTNETECLEVTWDIENINEYLFEEDASLQTPSFKTITNDADHKSHTWWKLYLENGQTSTPSFTVKLGKIKGDSNVSKCEMSLSTVFGIINLPEEKDFWRFTINKSAIFSEGSHLYHPQILKNVFTVKCKIWHDMMNPGQLFFRSILQKASFELVLDDTFNNVLMYDQDNLQITMTADKDGQCFLHTHEGQKKCKLLVEILPSQGGWYSFVKSKITLTCETINGIKSDKYINALKRYSTCSSRLWDICYQLNYFKKILVFEFIVAVETAYSLRPISSYLPSSAENTHFSSKQLVQVPRSLTTLSNDLLDLYSQKLLSDVTLNTEGKSFPAHRNILAARSPVFRAMFEKQEMSEALSGVVDIDDIDSATLHRLLVFLYGDSIADIKWEEALALYYAADKYAILPLKTKCVDILKAGLAVDNACDALSLADKHSEDELMRYTVDFIRSHDEVVSSEKWEELEKGNPWLAAKVTRELYLYLTRRKRIKV